LASRKGPTSGLQLLRKAKQAQHYAHPPNNASTHNSGGEHLQDREQLVAYLTEGKILLDGDPTTLPGEHGKETLEGLRAIVSGGHASALALLWGAGLAVAEVVAAGWFFTRVYRYGVRTGLIARYSAEAVS